MRKSVVARKSYFTGTLGENYVMAEYFRQDIICVPTKSDDFGEDIICDICEKSEQSEESFRTQFTFRTQVKTTEEIKKDGYIRKTSKGFSKSLDIALLDMSWYNKVVTPWYRIMI